MHKKELISVYFLALSSLVMLIITYLTGGIGWGLAVSLPLFLILIGFQDEFSRIFNKFIKK
ncbi:hypothetical protein SAMN04488113_12712 [Alkalibacterium gilvum]|uniref:Uncharacterized protein n=1 Tax=Alkalibacterium gilvum TaxID=1130080 RepID=A0A1H6U3B0_9LACT|nr:hypothetical protein SAMN04488113_12712 [Alkalibacterium gilvum]